jgi:hypothetical protein
MTNKMEHDDSLEANGHSDSQEIAIEILYYLVNTNIIIREGFI